MSPQRDERHLLKTIAFQTEFRPALPVVFGAKDYREFRDTLVEMDRILTVTGIEDRIITCRQKTELEDIFYPKNKTAQ